MKKATKRKKLAKKTPELIDLPIGIGSRVTLRGVQSAILMVVARGFNNSWVCGWFDFSKEDVVEKGYILSRHWTQIEFPEVCLEILPDKDNALFQLPGYSTII